MITNNNNYSTIRFESEWSGMFKISPGAQLKDLVNTLISIFFSIFIDFSYFTFVWFFFRLFNMDALMVILKQNDQFK